MGINLREYAKFVRRVLVIRHWLWRLVLLLPSVVGIVLTVIGFSPPERIDEGNSRLYVAGPGLILAGLVFGGAGIRLIIPYPGRPFPVAYDDFRPHNTEASQVDDLMGGVIHREATDPIDMAYGLWSVLQKRGAHNPPLATRTTPIGELYWILAQELIQITASLDFLWIAARYGQAEPGYPSWVPDWSAGKDDKKRYYGIGPVGWRLLSQEAKRRQKQRERGNQVLSLDPTGRVLTVRALDFGSVYDCFSFHKTSATNDDNNKILNFENLITDKLLHMENLRTMVSYWRWCVDHWQHPSFIFDGAELLESINREVTLSPWVKTLRSRWRRESLEKLFRSWLTGRVDSPTWFLRFLSIHLKICELVSHRDVRIITLKIWSSKSYMFNVPKAQIGDRVIRVWGLPHFLLVRKLAASSNSATLVGTIETSSTRQVLKQGLNELWGTYTVSEYSEYQIL
ncbi:hypothetical protein PFICI_03383 [Pestalotiopsis fici W106-1]|uniref:Heterokaryon incompatibility domain-containing protein n=1 Tax=Pestalotiopsis fici (strain W106-1 / CGMCC3.15140) TaxID=1229662 RepID=W3XGZ3_PESFW|nr:uncharacterized protein PFICI_03383 [Pestalotiopsis fici W106-1]ETS85358.1 hypothetical protein PFICI_03383 [Pestalotiopsis fici W106-1]